MAKKEEHVRDKNTKPHAHLLAPDRLGNNMRDIVDDI